MNIDVLWINCLVIALVGCAHAVLPAYGRRAIFFSVTVPEPFRDTAQARSLLRTFRWRILLLTAAAEGFMIAGLFAMTPWLPPVAILILLAGAKLIYARVRNQLRPYAIAPSVERIAPLAGPSDGLLGNYLKLGSALLPLILSALFAWRHWSGIADTIAVWNGFVVNGSLDAVLLLVAVAILHGSRRGSSLRALNLTLIVSFMWVYGSASAIFVALRWFDPAERFSQRAFPLVLLVPIAAILVWAFRKASRLRDNSDTTPDECWKLGQFYFNRHDPAFFVERRFGLGYSPNFARPLSWVTAALVLSILFVAAAALLLATRG